MGEPSYTQKAIADSFPEFKWIIVQVQNSEENKKLLERVILGYGFKKEAKASGKHYLVKQGAKININNQHTDKECKLKNKTPHEVSDLYALLGRDRSRILTLEVKKPLLVSNDRYYYLFYRY